MGRGMEGRLVSPILQVRKLRRGAPGVQEECLVLRSGPPLPTLPYYLPHSGNHWVWSLEPRKPQVPCGCAVCLLQSRGSGWVHLRLSPYPSAPQHSHSPWAQSLGPRSLGTQAPLWGSSALSPGAMPWQPLSCSPGGWQEAQGPRLAPDEAAPPCVGGRCQWEPFDLVPSYPELGANAAPCWRLARPL